MDFLENYSYAVPPSAVFTAFPQIVGGLLGKKPCKTAQFKRVSGYELEDIEPTQVYLAPEVRVEWKKTAARLEVYVFQFLCYALWPQRGMVNLALYLVYTYASAYLIAKCIQQPIQRLEGSLDRKMVGSRIEFKL